VSAERALAQAIATGVGHRIETWTLLAVEVTLARMRRRVVPAAISVLLFGGVFGWSADAMAQSQRCGVVAGPDWKNSLGLSGSTYTVTSVGTNEAATCALALPFVRVIVKLNWVVAQARAPSLLKGWTCRIRRAHGVYGNAPNAVTGACKRNVAYPMLFGWAEGK
jgi:hypothetical protein